MAEAWEGLMPRDNPRDTRFAINFFTSIGLGALTEDLRAHLKNAPKPVAVVAPMTRGGYCRLKMILNVKYFLCRSAEQLGQQQQL